MDDIPCLACGTFFSPRNKLQSYCSHPDCQKVRKAIWQRDQMKNNSEYRDNQRLSQQKWLAKNPDGHPKSPTCGHLKIPHLVTKKN